MAKHLNADELTDLALGADTRPTPRQRDHLARCPRCREELDQLRRVVRAARGVSTDDFLTAPPDTVWHTIAAHLGGDTAPQRPTETDATPTAQAGPGAPDVHDAPDVRDVPGGRHGPGELGGADGRPGPGGRDVPGDGGSGGLGRGRAWPPRPALLIAAASLVVGALLGSAVTAWRLDDGPPAAEASAANRLAPLAVPHAAGTVRLVRGPEAEREVTVTVTGLPRTDGYYEVWLMDRTHTRLVAMGVLGPDGTATLPLPARIDLGRYPLIDVSAQEDDGNPAHSGTSVVRGTLPG
ncbi:anti-sigma factor [Streptomyces neyagawaensis]|uniref:anti-sigma factor n=1 Tax=Streptomyces neyagawaensis TaxID=42238 RepID=UPI0006E40BA2|nr:anti-sigma factor [Streptomyces neyagawaensis]MCL6731090.1 anti-sigma factor [Streptomyces neyagawaensis]MDE1686188.1 anti-sigma factor [Streptomyces neyagawaensis]